MHPPTAVPTSRPSPPKSFPVPRLPLFEALARHHSDSTVVIHSLSGRRFRYGELAADVRAARAQLHHAAAGAAGDREAEGLAAQPGPDLNGQRVAFMVENGYDYVVTLLAILAARAIAVPLSPAFPAPELQYIVNHSQASLLVSSSKFLPKVREVLAAGLDAPPPALVEIRKHLGRKAAGSGSGPEHEWSLDDAYDPGDAGMMLYTSGTTSRPKGVFLPESALTAQCRSLLEAWAYSSSDHLLHVLPLHHIHGTVNALLAPLFAGAAVEFLFPFNADAVWRRLAAPLLEYNGRGEDGAATTPLPKEPVTFFTAVPTVYSRLLTSFLSLPPDILEPGRTAVSPARMRLAISGSAALPTPVKRAWRELTCGTVLLERYGMTEVGMALSCGLDVADRVDGSVGWPLPGVEARLVDLDTDEVIAPSHAGPLVTNVTVGSDEGSPRERAGEIQLRGPAVFRGYWPDPSPSRPDFVPADDDDNNNNNDSVRGVASWFRTGDVAVRRFVAGTGHNPAQPWTSGPAWFVLGRLSADIIKTGGEKVSALEVERELLSVPGVAEAAVVAVPSGRWGQKVGAVVVLDRSQGGPNGNKAGSGTFSAMDMRRALRGRLANYKIPQVLRVVDSLPRNAMGKINKKQLVKQVFEDEASGDEGG